MRIFSVFIFVCLANAAFSQATFTGIIKNINNEPVIGATILLLPDSTGATSDTQGRFTIRLNNKKISILRISHLQYETVDLEINSLKEDDIEIILEDHSEILGGLEIAGGASSILSVTSIRINPESLQLTPVPFQDISNIIATLPSVTSNNELSSAYSVRGGSYDENLVLVDGIPVYRPFLVRAGQEEGLSFVNTDLVSSVNFSAGGWPVIYDDKMASVLAANYRQPSNLAGSAMISLLGAKAHVEGKIGERISFLTGVRHKRSAYLLNTLDVDGDYRPAFTDVQALLKADISKNTSAEVLFSHANNNYSVQPSFSTTSFGTFNKELRLLVAFDGQQQMKYRTYQSALKLDHRFSTKLDMSVTASVSSYGEIENIDVEGGYRLCDVDKNLSSSTFNECISTRGIGTLYNYARNRLNSTLIDSEASLSYSISSSQQLMAGLAYSKQLFKDELKEYEMIDSADYVTIISRVNAENETDANVVKAFVQHSLVLNAWTMTYGVRLNHNTLNKYTLVSPRLLIAYEPPSDDRWSFSLGAGLYGQQPFYKEFRKTDGTIKTDIPGQSSLHINLGMEYDISWWGRQFIFSSEVYYKSLWNQIPYIIENVRQQYFPEYAARARSVGFEARLGGEFIPGTESWFSFGVMSAKEKIPGLDPGFIRRPTDQRFKVAFVFEDHVPWDPSLRVNLGFQYGSGLPISPPNDLQLRNSFEGDDYSRLDIGFSKIFTVHDKFFDSIRFGVEINNLLGSRNAVSYTWIQDINSQQFAVPNYLTGRLFNVVLATRF